MAGINSEITISTEKESEAKALLARYRYDIFLKRFGEQEVSA